MDSYDDWLLQAQETVFDLYINTFSVEHIKAFLEFFGLCPVSCELKETTARKYALVDSESSNWLTTNDLFYLDYCEKMYIVENEEFDVVYCVMDCNNQDIYIHSAALVKVLSALRERNTLFVFQHGGMLAFGCKRHFFKEVRGNFCVSDYFSHERWEEIADILCMHNESLEDISASIIEHSQAEANSAYYERPVFSQNYLDSLWDIETYHHVPTAVERCRYWYSFITQEAVFRYSYVDACRELTDLVNAEEYDELEWAFDDYEYSEDYSDEENIHDDYNGDGFGSVPGEDELFGDYDEEDEDDNRWLADLSIDAFENAEQMLNEMLKKRPFSD